MDIWGWLLDGLVVLGAALKDAALDQAAEMSIGNVVGSNIANVLLVLGKAALIRPIACDAKGLRIDTTIMIAASVVFAVICVSGVVERWQGMVMVAALAAFVIETVWEHDDPNTWAECSYCGAGEVQSPLPLPHTLTCPVVVGRDLLARIDGGTTS